MVDTVQAETAGKPPPSPPRAGRWDAAVVGRRVALALYAVLAVWVMGSGLVSVVPQVYWPEVAEERAVADCGAEIESLVTSLEEIAAVRPEPLRRERFRAWDERFLAVRGSCAQAPGYASLYHARYAVETAASRTDDELAPLLDEVRARARASGDR